MEMIEVRTFCSSCDPEVAECAPRKRVPAASIDPDQLERIRQRGWMSSHEDCAFHFGLQMKALNDELAAALAPAKVAAGLVVGAGGLGHGVRS